MKNKINIGIIGKNFGYNVIYKAFSKNNKYEIKGFSFNSKKKIGINFPKKIKIYHDWKRLVLDKKINSIVVATPPSLHKKIIKFAINNNKNIFCEKPLACSYQDANYICNLIKRKKNICHMVNYEFAEIDAFLFFKRKIINNIKIKEIHLNWFVNQKKRSNKNWKENHSKGGGIMFNFVCHAIHYLELLFGRIIAVKVNICLEKNKKIKTLKGNIFFVNGLSARLNIEIGETKNKKEPIHQLKIISNKKIYHLESKLNSLTDKFHLRVVKNNFKGKFGKILFRNKEDNDDFRINPTFKNSKKFANWILKDQMMSPNFFDAKRIHLITRKMILSSKKNKLVSIN